MPRNANKRRCSAVTKGGKRCSNWARRESKDGARDRDRGEPLCNVHAKGALPEGGKRRCSARTASGGRCANWTMAGKTVCNIHAELMKPGDGDKRRCVAQRRDGEQCGRWAVRDSERIHGRRLCSAHGGGLFPEKEDERRCSALTEAGRRCRNWATVATREEGKGLCSIHAGRWRLPNEDEAAAGKRCTAVTASGERCSQWAAVDSEARWGRPLCGVHGRETHWRSPEPGERRCTATTLAGERCAHWALGGEIDIALKVKTKV